MGSYLAKGRLYDKICNRAESVFSDRYLDGEYADLDDCIDDSLDYFFQDIMKNRDYAHIEDEDTLLRLLKRELLEDLDEDDIIDSLDEDSGPESDYDRNYGIGRFF